MLLPFLFFAVVAQAQDVTIPAPVAAFFLEQNERAKILTKEVDTLTSDVKELEKLDSARQLELVNAQTRYIVYDSLLLLKKQELDSCYNRGQFLEKNLTKSKRSTKLALAGGGLLVLILLIFQ
jgi:hypothetical protein